MNARAFSRRVLLLSSLLAPAVAPAVPFANSNSATFRYTTNGNGGLPAGVDQTKSIVRYPFAPVGGTICQ
jgi:hypothetical protein